MLLGRHYFLTNYLQATLIRKKEREREILLVSMCPIDTVYNTRLEKVVSYMLLYFV